MNRITELYLVFTGNLKRYSRLILSVCWILLGLSAYFFATETEFSRKAGIVQIFVGIAFGFYYFFGERDTDHK